jgi:hypothetical protein
VGRNAGLAEATLRLPFDHPDIMGELVRAFKELVETYGRGSFDVVVTANVVLKGLGEKTYRVFFGQDYSKASSSGHQADYAMNAEIVRDMSDVSNLRTDYDQRDFENVFFNYFENSNVYVHSMINLVYIMRRHLADFKSQRTIPKGKVYQTLY